MAVVKPSQMDIELENTQWNNTGTISSTSAMPRLDLCHNCGKTHAVHVDGKCLFEASKFIPVDQDREQFRQRFLSWAAGQKLEEALCRIVYELTRRDQ